MKIVTLDVAIKQAKTELIKLKQKLTKFLSFPRKKLDVLN